VIERPQPQPLCRTNESAATPTNFLDKQKEAAIKYLMTITYTGTDDKLTAIIANIVLIPKLLHRMAELKAPSFLYALYALFFQAE
jgi:hypothetical protein